MHNGGLLAKVRKALKERVLNAEMCHHLNQEPEGESDSPPQRPQMQGGGLGGAMALTARRYRQGRFGPRLLEGSAWNRIVPFFAFFFELLLCTAMRLVE